MTSGFDEPVFALGPVGQITLAVADLDRSETFYGEVLGLRKLFGSVGQAAYDCGEIRLLLQRRAAGEDVRPASPICFRVHDIRRARQELEAQGVVFVEGLQLVAAFDRYDLWMTYFVDPDGHRLALMMEGPKGFAA